MKKWSWRGFLSGTPVCGDCVEIIRDGCPLLAFCASEGLLAKAARTAYANPHTHAMPCNNLRVLGVARQIASKGVYRFLKVSVSLASVAVTPLLVGALAQTLAQDIRAHLAQVATGHSKAHHASKLMSLSRVDPTSLGTVHSCAVEGLGDIVKHDVSPFVRSF